MQESLRELLCVPGPWRELGEQLQKPLFQGVGSRGCAAKLGSWARGHSAASAPYSNTHLRLPLPYFPHEEKGAGKPGVGQVWFPLGSTDQLGC